MTPSGADLSRIATQGHLFSQIIRKFVVKVEVGYFLFFLILSFSIYFAIVGFFRDI